MTREIKFRAKKINKNEFVIGYYLPMAEGYRHYIYLPLEYLNEHSRIEIDPKTLGQYTGFKDINGREIYEGDVVYICGLGNYTVRDIRADYDTLLNAKMENDLGEIIDNIYRYPELLNKEENDK